GIEINKRGGGHGRALIAALLATPPGQRTYVVRVQRSSRYVRQISHLLQSFGFQSAGETARLRWFVRKDAPAPLAERIRGGVDAADQRTHLLVAALEQDLRRPLRGCLVGTGAVHDDLAVAWKVVETCNRIEVEQHRATNVRPIALRDLRTDVDDERRGLFLDAC